MKTIPCNQKHPTCHRPLKVGCRMAFLAVATTACILLTGCFGFLKPAKPTARHFVLTALPDTAATSFPATQAVGVGQVKLPAYLLNSWFAARKGTNEIDYLQSVTWAEPLQPGFQRVLAANLMRLVPCSSVRLSAWQREQVTREVYISVEQFDIDTSGTGVLNADWRVLSPGGQITLKTGSVRLSRPGPAPSDEPSGAVATLSSLVADLSRELAQVIRASDLPGRSTAGIGSRP